MAIQSGKFGIRCGGWLVDHEVKLVRKRFSLILTSIVGQ